MAGRTTTTTTIGPTAAPVPTTLPTRVLGQSAVDPGDPGDPDDPFVVAGAELAQTGASSLGLLLAAGLALLLLGAVLIGIGRASDVLGSDG